MLKKATIKKVLGNVKKSMSDFLAMDPEKLHVSISRGNDKIGRVLNVSTSPVITCGNCKECAPFCYAMRDLYRFANTVIPARAKNTVLAMYHRDKYFAEIDKAMSRKRTNKYFRYHVAGEIIDFDYLCRMVETARNHPDFIVWTYTKMHALVNLYCKTYGREAIPNNFIIMFSEWDGMPLINPYNFPIFTCKLKKGNKNHPAEYFETLYKCPGNCDDCKRDKRGCIVGESTYCNEH